MAWYRNHYECYRCAYVWEDEWSCEVDDDCPACDARHVSAHDSDDLTYMIEEQSGCFVVLRSPPTAGHEPDYEEVIVFLELWWAQAYIDADPEKPLV